VHIFNIYIIKICFFELFPIHLKSIFVENKTGGVNMAKKNNPKKPKNNMEAAREITPDTKNCSKPGCKEKCK